MQEFGGTASASIGYAQRLRVDGLLEQVARQSRIAEPFLADRETQDRRERIGCSCAQPVVTVGSNFLGSGNRLEGTVILELNFAGETRTQSGIGIQKCVCEPMSD